jgi:threonine dehydrogenase-like Zn-dependent dehydrogenase
MAYEALPKVHRALVQRVYAEPLQVETIPTPQPTPGSAIVNVLTANVISYLGGVYNGERKYSYPNPIVTGTSAVGHIAALGPDSTSLKIGQLVYVDCVIRGRDDPSAIILSGIADGSTEGGRKLMHGEWRDSTFAEYVKAPLENCFPLNDSLLCGNPTDGGLGYEIERLSYIFTLLVPFGGMRDIRLEAGETVIIAPATGGFGGAAVLVALAMGARVIAMGRNAEALAKLKNLSKRVETVRITGNQEEEVAALQKFGPADAFLDISPAEAKNSTHMKSAILSLRYAGRVSLMGGLTEDVAIPHRIIMRKDIKLRGKWMYSGDDIRLLVKMVEIGILSLDEKNGIAVVGKFPLEKWQEAFDLAAKSTAAGQMVVLNP